MFKVEFRTSGAAFEDPDGIDSEIYRAMEADRILKRICADLASGKDSGTIMDLCGNRVGQWSMD